MSFVRLALPKACNGVPAHIEEKYKILGLHVDFAKKEHTAELIGLFRSERLRETLNMREHYAVGTVFSFAAALIE